MNSCWQLLYAGQRLERVDRSRCYPMGSMGQLRLKHVWVLERVWFAIAMTTRDLVVVTNLPHRFMLSAGHGDNPKA